MINKLKQKTSPDTDALIEAIIQGMQNKKAEDITVLDLQNVGNAVATYFILCTGQAKTQVSAIREGILEMSDQKAGQRPWRQEGLTNREWILLDYVDVVVHVFHSEQRVFYALENLWGDAAIMQIKT
jgi:ribosome-associated protein